MQPAPGQPFQALPMSTWSGLQDTMGIHKTSQKPTGLFITMKIDLLCNSTNNMPTNNHSKGQARIINYKKEKVIQTRSSWVLRKISFGAQGRKPPWRNRLWRSVNERAFSLTCHVRPKRERWCDAGKNLTHQNFICSRMLKWNCFSIFWLRA